MLFKKPTDDVEKLLSEEKSLEDLKQALISQEKSLGDRKHTLIDDLLKQREVAIGHFDEKLAKLGYHANTNQPPSTTPTVGDLDAGGVYVGKSATTGLGLHAALADEPRLLTFAEAFEAAAQMRKLPGRENARVPTPEELNENLYKNSDKGHLAGTFNDHTCHAHRYHSSMPLGNHGSRVQSFRDGCQDYSDKDATASVRLVW